MNQTWHRLYHKQQVMSSRIWALFDGNFDASGYGNDEDKLGKTILGNSPVTEDSQYLKSGGDDRNEKWNSMDYKFFIYYTQQKSYI